MSSPELAGILVHTSPGRYLAMRDFYVEVLGLIPRHDRDGFVNFEFGDHRLTITVHDSVTGQAVAPERIMVNFSVADIEASFREVVTRGAPEIRSPSPEPWGGIVATLADPDGNIVQLLQLP